MGHAVRRIEEQLEVGHDFVTIVDVVDGTVTYRRPGQPEQKARIAAACLLQPAPGDRVLVVERGREAYVLSVLERASTDAARLSLEGDVELNTSGRLRVTAGEGVELVTKKAIQFLSSAVKIRAAEGELAIDRVSLLGRELVAQTRAAKLVTGALESFVDRLHSHVKYSYKTVEEMEQLRAKRIDYRTQEEISMRGKHAFVHAADLVKVTGAQIHMG